MHRAVSVLLILMVIAVIGAAYSCQPKAERPFDALIGYGCGPGKDTYLAAEEDHFPACERIIPNPIYKEK